MNKKGLEAFTVEAVKGIKIGRVTTFNYDPSRPKDHASYYHRDRLGSGLLITGSKAEVIQRKGYSPYGETLPDYMLVPNNNMTSQLVVGTPGISRAQMATRRIMVDTTVIAQFKTVMAKAEQVQELPEKNIHLLSSVLTVNSVTDGLRGFTGHENLADSQLVHMNARLYDPKIGRFMTPDSVIPDTNKPQAYNRYSYVYNNPASYTDPSGHNPLAFAALYFVLAHTYSDSQFHHTLSSVLLAAASGGYAPEGALGAAATAGATSLVSSALLSGRISGTELRNAAFSAAAGAIAFQIGEVNVGQNGWQLKVLYHGASQGAIGWVRNKNFWGSALAGAAGHLAGAAMQSAGLTSGKLAASPGAIAARTSVAAVFGGLAAKATGGDFAQGAMTAAIVHLYNCESHECAGSREEDAPIGGYSPTSGTYLKV